MAQMSGLITLLSVSSSSLVTCFTSEMPRFCVKPRASEATARTCSNWSPFVVVDSAGSPVGTVEDASA